MQTGSVLGDLILKTFVDASGLPNTFFSFPVVGNVSNEIVPLPGRVRIPLNISVSPLGANTRGNSQ